MNRQLDNIEPTQAESDNFFRGLPANIRTVSRAAAPSVARVSADGLSPDTQAEINKDSPAVVAFADGVSLENREEVLLGVEFAETVASNKFDINTAPIDWLTAYAEALKYAGWLTLGGHDYGDYRASSQSITMDSVVLEMIGAVAGPNAQLVISLLQIVIDKLQKNDSMMTLFERNAKKGNTSTFRIMPCVESAGGIPLTYLLSVHCTYSEESGGALFWKWSISRMQVKRLAKGVQFSRGAYERNKDKVLDYLQGDADDFFNGLK